MTLNLKNHINKSPRIGGFRGLEHLLNRRGLVSKSLKIT